MLENRSLSLSRPKNSHDLPLLTPPTLNLENLNLSEELAEHYAVVKTYRDAVQLNADAYLPTQVAATLRTLTDVLARIVKLQAEVVNQERLKNVEDAIIASLKTAPQEVQDAFLAAYRELAKE